MQKCQHPRTLLKILIRSVRRKWQSGSTVFLPSSRKTKIASFASEPRLRGSMQKANWKFSISSTTVWWFVYSWSQSSTKDVHLYAIIDTQSWCRTWPPNGSSRICAKQKLHRKHSEACKSSWSPIGSLKSFTLTIPWNSANLVKISPGIIARPHHIDQKQMRLLKEQCAE